MVPNAEPTTTGEEHDVRRQDDVGPSPTAESASGQTGGLAGFSAAFAESPRRGARLLSDQTLALSSNSSVRGAAFRQAQRAYGNQFVQRALIQRKVQPASVHASAVQPQCACGGTCKSCQLSARKQAASELSPPTATTSPTNNPAVGKSEAPGEQSDLILTDRGEPLARQTRELMETRFGHDFGDIRVHTDQRAAASAETLNANAFTSGRDIYFAQGKYQPESKDGQHLLAHELAHTIQQSDSTPAAPNLTLRELNIAPPEDAQERQADKAADAVAAGVLPHVDVATGTGGSKQRQVVHRDPRDVFAGKSYDLKTNKGVLEMARDWQMQLWNDWSSFPQASKERIKAGRAMVIYADHFLPLFQKAAEEAANPSFLMQQVIAGVNQSIASGETEAESEKYIDVRSYRTWFPEHYSTEYFEEANKLRREQRKDFAYFEKAKLDHLYDREKYSGFAAVQYVDGLAADMLDEQALRILAGQWPTLPFKEHKLFIRIEAMDKAEAIAAQEWPEAVARMDAKKFKSEQADKRYADTVQKLAQFVSLKKGLLTGTTSADQGPWIEGRIEDLVMQLREDFGVQMDPARLFEVVTTGAELRKVTGRIDISPEGKLYLGKRLTFRAMLDYIPPGRQVRLGWRWVTGGRESKFILNKPDHVIGKAALADPLELVPPFWQLGPYKYEVGRHGGMEIAAYVYLGDDDTPVTRLSTGWLEMPRQAPTELYVMGAPKKTVQGAPVEFSMGPWIPELGNFNVQWFVDGQLESNIWTFKHAFQTTGKHSVSVKIRNQDPGFFGDTDQGLLLASEPVEVLVIEPAEFGESILAELDKPLAPGLSQGTLADVAKSTESSIQELERRAALEQDSSYWKDRVEAERKRLRKIQEFVPDLAEAEKLPEDKLKLEQGRLYSGPIPAVLIHPEKGVTIPLAIYLVVKYSNAGWHAQLIDATGKIVHYTGSGSTTQDAYVSAFSAWQSDNEYPIGGQVVYRFDPVVFRGAGQPDRKSFSTTTPWKKAKDWWDKATAVVGIIVGGLLLVAPEATITKALALALLAAATARSVIAIKERLDLGYELLDRENLLEAISIAASVTGIGGTLMRTLGMRAARPLITRIGTALIITSTASDVGTFIYATSEAIAMLRAIDDDPTLDDAQKQVEILRVMAGLFVNTLLIVATNKDLIKGKLFVKTKIESGEPIKLDSATRVDMELELRATGEHEGFLKRVQGMEAEARDRVLVEWVVDARVRAGLKPTADNVRHVTDPKFTADYDAEMTVADHTYRRSRKNGRWCRFTDPICGIDLVNINPEVDLLLTQKTAAPGEPNVPSLEDITTYPGPQLAPAKPGGPPRSLPPGMGEHKAARWREYQAAGGTWPIERWGELYDRRIEIRRAEIAAEVKELGVKKQTLETNLAELKEKAQAAKAEVDKLAGQAAIAKGDAKTQLNGQLQQARAASEQASQQEKTTHQEVIETQVQIQRLQSQLNLDARSRLPCFAADTLVWTPTGTRPIQDLHVNDLVFACDLHTFATVTRKVLEVHQNNTMRFYHIEVAGMRIRATSLHRFWVESQRQWVEAHDLEVGMELRTLCGTTAVITKIDLHEAPSASTYNLHVERSATYFVGAGVLVHNNGGTTYSFGNLRIYVGVNANFPGYVYVGQTDDLARRQEEHRAEAIEMLKKPNLTQEQREFWKFKSEIVLEERVSGLNADQANYLEQKNITLERDTAKVAAFDEESDVKFGKVMNRREQVSRKNMTALEKKIMEDPAVKASGVCP